MGSTISQSVTTDHGIRAVSGISSALSVLGSLLIIISYYCFKNLRTRARLILVHLALSDMGVGLANLIGIAVNFDRFYIHVHSDDERDYFKPNSTAIDNLCKAQAFFALFFTLSSVLWTSSLAVYMYLLIVTKSQKQMRYFMWFSCTFSYGMSLFVNIWMLVTGKVGYAPYNSSGWCSAIILQPDPNNPSVPKSSLFDYMAQVLGYDLWIYLTMLLTILLYVSVFIYVRMQYNDMFASADAKLYWQAMHNIDYKFIMIPVMFIFLRVWSAMLNIYESSTDDTTSPLYKALVYLSGIGDSGQGFVNAILFVLFTQSVRKRLLSGDCFKRLKNHSTRSVQETSIYSDSKFLINSNEGVQTKVKTYSDVPEAVETVGKSQSFDRGPSVTPTRYSSGKY